MSSLLLDVAGLEVRYGISTAVRDVNLSLENGSSVSLLGANGAGKSSCLMAITGLVKPVAGRITIDGDEARLGDPRWAIRHGVVLVPEGVRNFGTLTVQDNLEIPRRTLNRTVHQADLDAVFEIFPVLYDRRQQTAGTLSGGEQKMLAIGRGLMSEPKVLCVDEPSLGLAPSIIQRIADALSVLRERGIAVILAEQSVRLVEAYGGQVCVLERGVTVWRGPSEGLANNERVASAIVGGGTQLTGK